jgi:hypothetical protein
MYITLFMVETALHVILCFCRYLLVIWKARYPQQFTEGWLVMRQELTKLYTRFYVPLLSFFSYKPQEIWSFFFEGFNFKIVAE